MLYKLIRLDLESCGTMKNYVNRMISTCHQLNEIGFTIPDRFVGVLLLAGLPEKLRHLDNWRLDKTIFFARGVDTRRKNGAGCER